MRKPVSGWKLLAKQLNAAYRNACLLPALLPVSLTTHLHLPHDLYKTRRTMKLFSKMTLTFSPTVVKTALSPSKGKRALSDAS